MNDSLIYSASVVSFGLGNTAKCSLSPFGVIYILYIIYTYIINISMTICLMEFDSRGIMCARQCNLCETKVKTNIDMPVPSKATMPLHTVAASRNADDGENVADSGMIFLSPLFCCMFLFIVSGST